ncbi:MAG: 50S ribosomal protein L3 [Candidatus Babeliales bacterium]
MQQNKKKTFYGIKMGMGVFRLGDAVVPITVVTFGGWFVLQIKTEDRDGYSALKIGKLKERFSADVSVPLEWLKQPKVYFSYMREIALHEALHGIGVGMRIAPYSLVEENQYVDVGGTTRGKGFAGVVKRHGFAGPPGSHGSKMGKRPGAIGFLRTQGRVIKGKKLPGRAGGKQKTIQNVRVIRVNEAEGTMYLKGAVPGHPGSLISIKKVLV